MYLCYDLKGIQSFIFQIPRLKYIIGGSALVDRFDREVVPDLAEKRRWDLMASAGGKGVFRVGGADDAEQIKTELIRRAHKIGADIRFGFDANFSEAAQKADSLYPYLPQPNELDGHPCRESGLYPTMEGAHKVVRQRDWSHGVKLSRYFEEERGLREKLEGVEDPVFLRDVEEGTPAYLSLGGRNRWAVVCMDGNDMGSHFRAMASRDEETMCTWLKRMSKDLDQCSERACVAGMNRVLAEWVAQPDVARLLRDGKLSDDDGGTVVPLRPLVVGGDDIVVLCHAGHAASFVCAASRAFEQESRRRAKRADKEGIELWPGTGGSLTISAGILYSGVTMPLASAIPYTEALLASAKRKGRLLRKEAFEEHDPAPACVDFEAVTETLLNTPQERRERELVFLDGDADDTRVELTCRPYSLDRFERLAAELLEPQLLRAVPNTILHQLLPGLRQSRSDREVFYARLGKHQGKLVAALRESVDGRSGNGSGASASRWRKGETKAGRSVLATDIIDLAILAEEGRRMEGSDA